MGRKIRWGRLFRRAAALFLATLAVWVLPLCTGAGAADALRDLAEDPDFAEAALAAELGEQPEGPLAGLDFWGRLAVGQSPLLLSVTGGEGEEETPDQEEAGEDQPQA